MQSGSIRPLGAPRLDTLRRSNGRLRRRPPRAWHRIYKWSYACRVCASRIDHWIDPGWNTVVGFVLAIPAKRLPVWAIRDFPTRPPRRRLGNAGSKPSPAHERRAAAEISLAFGDRPTPTPKIRDRDATQTCLANLHAIFKDGSVVLVQRPQARAKGRGAKIKTIARFCRSQL
jgi:hypothetical protein